MSASEYSAVVFAYHDVGVRCLSVLLAHGVDVALVVTHEDDPRENVWFESVEKLARAHDLEVATPADPNNAEFVGRLQSISPDLVFSFYYRFMLSPAVLATAMRGAYNMHGSLLPKYRGRVPVNWAVLRGETKTGATLHEMVEKPDAGRIVDQMEVPILPDDRALDVFRKVTVAAEIVLDRSLPAILDVTARLTVQDLSRGGYFRGRKTDDGRIDWSKGARVHILATRVLEERGTGAPARLAVQDPYLVAECADGGRLRIIDWDVDGAPMDAPSFAARFGAQPLLTGELS